MFLNIFRVSGPSASCACFGRWPGGRFRKKKQQPRTRPSDKLSRGLVWWVTRKLQSAITARGAARPHSIRSYLGPLVSHGCLRFNIACSHAYKAPPIRNWEQETQEIDIHISQPFTLITRVCAYYSDCFVDVLIITFRICVLGRSVLLDLTFVSHLVFRSRTVLKVVSATTSKSIWNGFCILGPSVT